MPEFGYIHIHVHTSKGTNSFRPIPNVGEGERGITSAKRRAICTNFRKVVFDLSFQSRRPVSLTSLSLEPVDESSHVCHGVIVSRDFRKSGSSSRVMLGCDYFTTIQLLLCALVVVSPSPAQHTGVEGNWMLRMKSQHQF